ncbi:PGPGW domain-containing protein [Rhodopirellula sallentina]|uniref:Putative membrane protein n=1 Tax=Rhodopirellula sallentina SM41 TaxID=1263870 RepID=M5TXJ7_9BACT|nr:PGPGW domain-containing protein [Rhodopirellula sallentina]EMI53952.1 putative membrane protein [Rhodopirellula sallentina SM41]
MHLIDQLQTLLSEHRDALRYSAIFSGMIFVGSLLLVPYLVVRIPDDYFAKPRRPKTPFADRHPLLRMAGLIVKNLIGVLVLLSGVAMLILPGQGLLTMVIGILLLDFPGKHQLERRIIRIQPVISSINWLRSKANAPPLTTERPSHGMKGSDD